MLQKLVYLTLILLVSVQCVRLINIALLSTMPWISFNDPIYTVDVSIRLSEGQIIMELFLFCGIYFIVLISLILLLLLFSVRTANMQSTLYAIARPSVCLSHGWISQKRLKLGWCNFHHWVAQPLRFLRYAGWAKKVSLFIFAITLLSTASQFS